MATYDDRKTLEGIQDLRPLSIPHREEPEVEEEIEEEEPEEVDPTTIAALPTVQQNPVIIDFDASDFETVVNGEITVTCIAIDPDGDNSALIFEFKGEAGEFTDQTLDIDMATGNAIATVKWTAPATIPDDPTEYLIDVTVTDVQGLTAFTGDHVDAQRPSLVIIVRLRCREPDRPDAPVVTLDTATSLNVRWTAPHDNGCDIEDYDLRHRVRVNDDSTPNDWIYPDEDNDAYLPVSDNIDGYEDTLTSLTDAVRHEVQVRATNEAGESDWSPSGFIPITPPAVTITAMPTVIALSGSNNLPSESAITVTATDIVDDSDDLTYEFTVFQKNADGTETNIGDMDLTGDGSMRTFSHPGVNADYDVSVTVTNSANLSTTERVTVDAIDRPDTPEAPEVTTVSTTSVTVGWDAPESNNSAISDFDVRYRLTVDEGDPENDWIEYTTGDNAVDIAWLPSNMDGGYEVTITGLTDLTSQEFQVRAANAAGESDWSESGSTPNAAPVTPPTVTMTAVPTVIALSGSNNLPFQSTITVTATDTVDDADDLTYEYTIFQVNTDGTETNIGDMDLTGSGAAQVFSHPGVNADYYVRVRVTNTRDVSTDERVLVEAIDVPNAPDKPNVTAPSTTSITVNWTAPESNNSDITDYDLRYRVRVEQGMTENAWIEYTTGDNDDDIAWLPTDGDGGYEVTITGLTDVNDQEVQVRAANAAGESDWSESGIVPDSMQPVATRPPTATIAAVPTVIALSGSNNLPDESNITVTATDDVDDVEDLTYEYTVFQVNPDGTETNIGDMDLTGEVATRVFSHPGTNANYYVRVRVTNSGNFSVTDRVLVRAIDVPDAPERPSVTLIDLSSVEVRWEAPESNNSLITDYDVRYRLGESGSYQEWMASEAFTDRQATITGLGSDAPNAHVEVRAYNEAGESDWSEAANVNGPPVITAFTGQIVGDSSSSPVSGSITINNDDTVLLIATANDTDNPPDPLAYSFDVIEIDGVAVTTSDDKGTFRDVPNTPNQQRYFAPIAARNKTFTIQVTVRDGLPEDGGLSDTETIDVVVANRAPTVEITSHDATIRTSGASDIVALLTDLDNDRITHTWTIVDVNDSTNTDVGRVLTASGMTHPILSTRGGISVTNTYYAPTSAGTYRVTVTATDASGGSNSASVDIAVVDQIQRPQPPTLSSVVPVDGSHTQLLVTWEAPTDNGGADITAYDIKYRADADMDPSTHTYTVQTGDGNTLTHTLTGLTENTLYHVYVIARNSVGDSDPSNTLMARTTTDFTITLTADNTTVNKGDTVNLVASANAPVDSYVWTVTPDSGTFQTSDSANIRDWVAPHRSSLYQAEDNSISNAYTITVTATPTNGTASSASILITVVNRAPRIISVVASGLTLSAGIPRVAPGSVVVITVQSRDDDTDNDGNGDDIEYTWTHDSGTGSETDSFDMGIFRSVYRWTLPTTPGLYTIKAVVEDDDYVTDSDGNTVEASDEREIQIRVNTAPTITIAGPTTPVDAETTHTLTVTINDPDNDGTDQEIDERYITFINHEGGGSYPGDITRVSEGNYTQQWLAPSRKGTAVVEVQYQDYYESTLLSTVNARASIQVNNQAPRVRIVPDTAVISTVQQQLLTASPEAGRVLIDPDGDDVTFEWEIVSGIGRLFHDADGDGDVDEGETAIQGGSISTGQTTTIIYLPPSPPDAPAAPTVAIDPTDGTRLTVSWVAPNNNGADITDYDLRYKLSTQGESHWLGVDITGTGTTHTLENLMSSRGYDFQVRAENLAGESDWSSIGQGMTPNDPPTITSFTTLDDDIEINGQTTVNVVAADTDSDDLYYEYSIIDDPGDGTYGTIVADPNNEDRAVYTAPSDTGIFEVQVQVFDAPVGMRDSSITYPTRTLMITVASLPDKPDAPTVTALTNDLTKVVPRSRIRISWTAPDANNSAITSYDVQYREDGRSIYENVTLTNPLDTEVTVEDLKPNTLYYAHVRARNSVATNLGIGEWSDEGSDTTPTDVPYKPAAPTVTGVSGEPTSLQVNWVAPDNSGDTITDYNIQYRSSLETMWHDWEADTVSADTMTKITMLAQTTTYGIRIQAVNANGNSEWSDFGVGVTGRINLVPVITTFESNVDDDVVVVFQHPTLPETATLVVTATDDFTPVGDLTYTFSVPSGHGTVVQDADLTHTAVYTPPPTPGEYTVTVEVSDGDADLPQPTETIVITAINKPDAPAAPTVTADSNDSTKLDVRWTTPNTNFSSIIDYDVRYKKSTQPDSAYQIWDEDATTYINTFDTIEDLDGDTQYDVQVRASNIAGVSDWSPATSQSTRNTAPTIASFTSDPASVVTGGVSRLAVVASDLENTLLTYTFSLPHETMDDDHGTLEPITGETSQYKYTAPDTTGTYTVRVVVSDGTLSTSRDLPIVVTDGRPPPPDAPTVESNNAGSILVRWDPPPSFQGPPVDHYHVQYKLSTATSYTIYSDTNGDPVDITNQYQVISNLSAGDDYDVQVRAVNSSGSSDWSAAGTGAAGEEGVVVAPQPPVISSITSPSFDTLTVTWIKPPIDDDPNTDDDITSYDLQYREAADAGDPENDWEDVTLADDFVALTTDITGLTANTPYDVRVQANNSAGSSGYSDPPTEARTAIRIRPPTAPEGLMVSENPDPTKLNVSWSVPNLFGGTLVDYDIQYREAVGEGETENAWENWPATDTTDTNPSDEIENLTADTPYDVRVRAQNDSTLDEGNGVGTSPWSSPVEGSTAEEVTLARVPDAPSITSPLPATPGEDAVSDEHDEIDLAWSMPNNNGATITGYYVEYKTVGSNTWTALMRVSAELLNRTATIPNLTHDTRYNVRVYARNSVGDSPYSTEVTVKTAEFIPPPAPTVTVGTITTDSIAVSWVAPTSIHTITGYRVEWKLYSEPATSYRAWTRQMTGLSETVSGLSDGTRYNIRVAAVVGTVVGAWGTVDATTQVINVAPRILTYFANPTQITVDQTSTLVINASDANNDPLSYDLDITHFNGVNIESSMTDYGTITYAGLDSQNRRTYTFDPPNRDGNTGVYTVTAVVSDGDESVTDTENITVVDAPNNAPDVTVSGPTEAIENRDITLTGTVSEQDAGDTWTATWSVSPNVGTLSATTDSGDRTNNTSVITYTTPLRSAATRVTVTFQGTDNHGLSDSDSLEIDILPTPTAPERVTGVMASAVDGSHTSIDVSWSKPGNGGATIDKYEIRYVNTTTDVASTTEVTGEDTLSETLTGLDEGTEYEIQVRAHNSVDWGLYSRTARASTTSDNNAPVVNLRISGNTVTTYDVDQLDTIRIDVVATDVEDDDDDLTISWSNNGGTLSGTSDTFRLWRAPGDGGTYGVTVTAEDSGGKRTTATVDLVVDNHAPEIVSLTDGRRICPGATVVITVTARDEDSGDTLSYSWDETGTISLGGRRLTWEAPDSSGSYPITVTVTDNDASPASASQTTTFIVNTAPEVSLSASDTTVGANEEITITADITDPDTTPNDMVISWGAGGGTWVTSPVISGSSVSRTWRAPLAKRDYTVSVNVSDGCASDSDTITITVENSPPNPSIDPDDTTLVIGQQEQFTVTHGDPDGNSDIKSYAWSVSGSGNGSIVGASNRSTVTVNYNNGTQGTDTLTCVVTDNSDEEGTATATITVIPLAAPTVTVSADASTVDPGGTVGITADIESLGSSGIVTWTRTGGTLSGSSNTNRTYRAPNRVRAGTEYTITVAARNSEGSDSDSVTLTINNVAPVVNSISSVPPTIRVGQSDVFTANASDNNGSGDTLDYSWTPVDLFTNADQRSATFNAPSTTDEASAEVEFEVEVTDNPPSPYLELAGTETDTIIVVPNNPGTPRNLALDATSTDTDSLEFTWDAPTNNGGAPITGYPYELRQGSTIVESGTVTSESVFLSDLDAGTTYTLRVRASNQFEINGTTYGGISSQVSRSGTTDEDAPTVTLSAVDNVLDPNETTTITADIEDLGDSGTVTWTRTGGTLSGTSDTSRTYTAPNNVRAGTEYTITVTARNGGGSHSDSITITINNVAPTVDITSLQSTMTVGGTDTITANADDANGDSIASYAWTADAGTFSSSTIQSPTYTAPSRTSESDAEVTIEVDVTDSPPSGYGDLEGSDSDTVIIVPNNPGIPRNVVLDATSTDTDSLEFTWDAPTNDGGAPITGYPYELRQGSTIVESGTETGESVHFSGLQAGTTYTLRVRASNQFEIDGTTYGGISSQVHRSGTTDVDTPTVTVSAASSTVIPGGDVEITAEIEDLGDSGTVTWTRTGGTLSGSSNTSRTYTAPTNVRAGTEYTITVTATNSGGSDSDSVTITIDNVAPTVDITSLRDTMTVGTSDTITATTDDNNNDSIASYDWTADRGSFSNDSIQSPRYTAPTRTSEADAEVTIEVEVEDDPPSGYVSLAGSDSDTVIIVPNNPGPPRNLTVDATSTSTDSLEFTWDAPTNDGGAPITSYGYFLLQGGLLIRGGDTTGESIHFSGLEAGTTYTLTLRAYNQFQIGDETYGGFSSSVSRNGTTDVDSPTISISADSTNVGPNETTEITAVTEDLGNSGTVTWTRTGGTLSGTSSTGATYRAPDNVRAGTTYTITATARNSAGSDSDSVTITIDNVAPTATITSLPATLRIGTSDNISVNTDDANNDSISSYSWTADRGSFSNDSIRSPRYTAPSTTSESDAEVTIEVEVEDNPPSGYVSLAGIGSDTVIIVPNNPGTPRNFALDSDATEHDTLEFTWDPPTSDGGAPITGYYAELYQGSTRVNTASGDETSRRVIWSNLEADTTYSCRLRATNVFTINGTDYGGNSSYVSRSGTTEDTPFAPTISISADSENIDPNGTTAITADVDDLGSGRVTWTRTGGTLSGTSNTGATYRAPNNVRAGTEYTITATATNPNGSDSDSITIEINNVAPTATITSVPATLRIGASDSISVNTDDDNNDSIDSYSWTATDGSFSDASIRSPRYNAPDTTDEINAEVTIEVEVEDDPPSGYVSLAGSDSDTVIIVPNNPGTPRNVALDATSTSESTLEFTWDAPTSNGGAPITGYPYELRQGSTIVESGTETGESVYFSGLQGGTTYTLRVRASNQFEINGTTYGGVSSQIHRSGTTDQAVPTVTVDANSTDLEPGETTTITADIENLGNSGTVTWTRTGGTLSGSSNTSRTYRAPSRVRAGTEYTITVTVRNSAGSDSDSVTIEIANAAPTVDITSLPATLRVGAGDRVTASASDPNGDSIGSYDWTADRGSFSNDAIRSPTYTAPSRTGEIDGEVTIEVEVEDSPPSGYVDLVGSDSDTLIIVPNNPGTPRNLHLEERTDTSLTFEWEAPTSDGGAPISGYTYLLTQVLPVDGDTITDTSVEITGLEPNTTYTFIVSSLNRFNIDGTDYGGQSSSARITARTLTM